MARARDLLKLTRERQKINAEISLLEKRIKLMQHELEVVDGEINHAIEYSRSPRAKEIGETAVKKKKD